MLRLHGGRRAGGKGGADRIELNSALFLGGLTPSIGALEAVKAQVKIPVMCMVRPREGRGFCYTAFDYDTVCRDALALVRAGADGVVFGFLNDDGTVDAARCADFSAASARKTRKSRRFSTARSTSCRTSLRRSTH